MKPIEIILFIITLASSVFELKTIFNFLKGY